MARYHQNYKTVHLLYMYTVRLTLFFVIAHYTKVQSVEKKGQQALYFNICKVRRVQEESFVVTRLLKTKKIQCMLLEPQVASAYFIF